MDLDPQSKAESLAASGQDALASPVAEAEQEPQTTASGQQGVQPESLQVVCGTIKGELLLQKGRVLHNGIEMTPTEFERAGGRAATKKWKQSVRVVMPDGRDGGPVGPWLLERNVAIGPVKATSSFANLQASTPSRQIPAARKALPHVKAEATAPAMPKILEHLEKQYIGLLLGDPTAGVLPEKLPTEGWSEREVVDLRELSDEQLAEMAAASAENPLGAMLVEAPGVEEGRVAYFTGHQPKRKPMSAMDKAKADAALDLYLEGRLLDPPWHALGASKPPVVGGKELDLQSLWKEVSAAGGYEACTIAKLWSRIATKLGVDLQVITNGSYLVRNHYQRFLLAKERRGKQQGGAAQQGSELPTAAMDVDVQMEAMASQQKEPAVTSRFLSN